LLGAQKLADRRCAPVTFGNLFGIAGLAGEAGFMAGRCPAA